MQGVVYKSTGSWYLVKTTDNNFLKCRIKGRLRIQGIKSTNPVTVGDLVEYEEETQILGEDILGVIKSVCERKNYLVRRSVNLSKKTHIIASNVDKAFLVITISQPLTTTVFIDRFLVASEAFNVPVTLVFNKVDLYSKEDHETLKQWKFIYESIGYECLETSIENAESLERLKGAMRNCISVFSGHSGVGKSSLVNAVEPNLALLVREISEYHNQGQHTTTFAEMFDLSFGGSIIDSPGIRGFGIVDIGVQELPNYFVEFFKLQARCRYYNCKHLDEPQCAVKSALEEGALAESRYRSYLQMVEESNSPYR